MSTPPTATPEPDSLLDRLDRLEAEGRTTLELMSRVVETLEGISANQRTLAENQRLVIECLSRLAERAESLG